MYYGILKLKKIKNRLRFRKVVQDTFLAPESRLNKCPKWSNNFETRPRSGSMDVLSIPENTQVGDTVYLLLAMDPEQEPIYYFIRKAESEVENDPDEPADDIIFRVNVIKMGFSWIGEVFNSEFFIFFFRFLNLIF